MLTSRLTAILAIALASLLALYFASETSRYRGLYETSQASLEQAQERTARIQRNTQKVDSQNAKLRFELDAALRKNPDWSDRDVPAAVYDSLCARANCASVQPMPTSTD